MWEWVDSLIHEWNLSVEMQLLLMVLVILGRFALDRWERRREIEQHRRRRNRGNG